jgi:hypothetical protein
MNHERARGVRTGAAVSRCAPPAQSCLDAHDAELHHGAREVGEEGRVVGIVALYERPRPGSYDEVYTCCRTCPASRRR